MSQKTQVRKEGMMKGLTKQEAERLTEMIEQKFDESERIEIGVLIRKFRQELSTQGVDELELFKFWWNKRNGEFLSISDYDIKKFRQSNLTDDPKGNINP